MQLHIWLIDYLRQWNLQPCIGSLTGPFFTKHPRVRKHSITPTIGISKINNLADNFQIWTIFLTLLLILNIYLTQFAAFWQASGSFQKFFELDSFKILFSKNPIFFTNISYYGSFWIENDKYRFWMVLHRYGFADSREFFKWKRQKIFGQGKLTMILFYFWVKY